jgi:acyl carrier protein
MSVLFDPDEVAKTIHGYIAESFVLDDDELGPETSLIESGIVDSTGIVEIVSFLEETFEIEFDDEELVAANLDSVSRLTRFVGNKLRAGAAPQL